MLQLVLLVAFLVTLFYLYCIKPMSYWADRGVKQTKPMWILGDYWKNLFRLESLPDMVRRTYSEVTGVRYFGIYQFALPTLVLKDPDLIKQITIKDFEHFMDHRPLISKEADPLFGNKLFSLKGKRWREIRPIISPSFTSSKMKIMFMLMSECAENFTNFYVNKNESIIEVEMKDSFTRFANDVIASTVFGIQTDSLREPTNEFYMMGKEATNLGKFKIRIKFIGYFLMPKILEFFKITFFDKHVSNFFVNLISSNIKERREKNIVRPDMIHLLMEAQKELLQKEDNVIDTGFAAVEECDLDQPGKSVLKITDFDIFTQAVSFFFAGFDSISSVMSFLAYELAVNSDVQNRLRKEIQKTLYDCQGHITYDALLNMKYMDMVVSECLRKWPFANAVDRVCTKDYIIEPATSDEKPLHLEKGSVLWLPIYGIHHDPKLYPNPEKFIPERFNDENKGKISPYSYIPFGSGPRNCLGNRFALMELKIVMFHLLTKFEIVPIAKTVIPLQLSKNTFNLLAERGFHLGLKLLV